MKTILNETLVAFINKSLPNGVKLVSFLMDILNLSRESTYRRIRNEISFTLEEAIIIATKLGFSLDEIAGQNKPNRVFFDYPEVLSTDTADIYTEIIDTAIGIYRNMDKSTDAEIVFTTNTLPVFFSLDYEILSKFLYYKWMHNTQDVPLNFYFSDFHLSGKVSAIHKKYRYAITKLNSITAIVSSEFILPIVKEVSYFYKRRLINKEEMLLLQDELMQLIHRLERDTYRGIHANGTKISLYKSTLDIHSNILWFRNGQDTGFQFWTHQEPITVYDSRVSLKYRNWLNSLLKYSILISECNEIQRSEFFNKQYEYIRNVESIDL